MNLRVVPFVALLFLVTSCSSDSPTPILDCVEKDDMAPDCRFQNPEDIVALPTGEQAIISQFGAMDGSKAGNIVRYTLDDASIETLFPRPHDDVRDWGDPECTPPDADAFAPHGIDLVQRDDGRWSLLVVNHGLRESIEFFEVQMKDDAATLHWRGCAEGPPPSYFNDVVAKPDGSFYVTHMMPKDAQLSAMLRASLLGSDIGHVYRWRSDEGFTKVPGSDGPMPNGIEMSQDEKFLFINMYIAGEVRKLDLDSGEVVATTAAQGPDNSTWSQDGYLLVASHTDTLGESMACQALEAGACGFAYEIVKIDPADMSRETLIKHRGAPLGGVTVATDTGDELLMGTFAGDRIVRLKKAGADR